MKIKSFSYGATVNLGNFESERFQVDVELTANEPFEESVDTAKMIVEEQLKRLPLAIQERLNAAMDNLSDAEIRAELLERANEGAMLQFNGLHQEIDAAKKELKQLLGRLEMANTEVEETKAFNRSLKEDVDALIQLGILVPPDSPKQMQGQTIPVSSREDNWDRYHESIGDSYEQIQGDNLP